MQHSSVRSKLDRSIIFLVIAATYVPYWGSLLPQQEAFMRLFAVALGTFFGLGLLLTEKSEKVVNIFWVLFAAAGLGVSFFELQQWLTKEGLLLFWIGTSLYGLQQLVYAAKHPNLKPGVFGYREMQHLLLLCATILGVIVVIFYI
jgi:hemolysin III